MAPLGTAGLPAWLTAPDAALLESLLPDPLSRWGRHVRWVCVAGVPVGHGDWTRTHAGQCPPGCTRLPDVPQANPYARSPAWDAWAAYIRGMPRMPSKPIEPPETGVTLRNRGGW